MNTKYSSNFGKAIFLGWLRSIIAFFVGIIVALIVWGSVGDGWVALLVFAIFPFAVWAIDILRRWKSFVYDGNVLVLKRICRPNKSFNVNDYRITVFYTEHSLFFLSIFVEPRIRLIDRDGNITDIYCPFMREATSRQLLDQIRADIQRRESLLRMQQCGGDL